MDPQVHLLQLSERDQERLSFVILKDFLSLVERATFCGTVFDRLGLVEQRFTLRMLSSDKSALAGKVTKGTSSTATNWISGSECLSGSLNSSQISQLSSRWETTLSKL